MYQERDWANFPVPNKEASAERDLSIAICHFHEDTAISIFFWSWNLHKKCLGGMQKGKIEISERKKKG